jgi:hypothetical protein
MHFWCLPWWQFCLNVTADVATALWQDTEILTWCIGPRQSCGFHPGYSIGRFMLSFLLHNLSVCHSSYLELLAWSIAYFVKKWVVIGDQMQTGLGCQRHYMAHRWYGWSCSWLLYPWLDAAWINTAQREEMRTFDIHAIVLMTFCKQETLRLLARTDTCPLADLHQTTGTLLSLIFTWLAAYASAHLHEPTGIHEPAWLRGSETFMLPSAVQVLYLLTRVPALLCGQGNPPALLFRKPGCYGLLAWSSGILAGLYSTLMAWIQLHAYCHWACFWIESRNAL